jgi:hypothetical protein
MFISKLQRIPSRITRSLKYLTPVRLARYHWSSRNDGDYSLVLKKHTIVGTKRFFSINIKNKKTRKKLENIQVSEESAALIHFKSTFKIQGGQLYCQNNTSTQWVLISI